MPSATVPPDGPQTATRFDADSADDRRGAARGLWVRKPAASEASNTMDRIANHIIGGRGR